MVLMTLIVIAVHMKHPLAWITGAVGKVQAPSVPSVPVPVKPVAGGPGTRTLSPPPVSTTTIPPFKTYTAHTASEQLPELPPLQTQDRLNEYGLLNFSFESRVLGAGFAPDARAKMTRKTAAEDNYKLIKCDLANGYGIKWSGRYLSVNTDGTVEWNMRKDEPNTCWRVETGYCGGDGAQYVMMKSLLNNQFLRVDGKTKNLICLDAPSTENAYQYCWKFQSDEPIRQRCGTYYHPDYQRVVTIPCEIVKDPPEGKQCDSVTSGFMAKCCGRHAGDTSCRSVFIREVVGRGLNEAALYIKTRFPGYKILKCARGDACEHADPFPLYDANLIVIPYDKRLGTVSAPAYRFI